MRVLHLGKYFPPYAGGMENYLRDLMAAQQRQGIESAALVHQSQLGFTSERENYEAGEQKLPVTRAAIWARLLFTPISPTFPWLLLRLIKATEPDILHLHMPNVAVFWAIILPGARKIPWVVHWHSDVLASKYNIGLRWFYALYRPFERLILRRASAIIATSPPYLEASAPLRSYRAKCHVVALGLNPVSLSMPPTAPVRRTGQPLRVLAVGRLTYYKGFEHLIRACADSENLVIHLVGDGNQETNLKDLVNELKLDSQVTFHGHLPPAELNAQLNACDCLCLPSIERTEAFGMVLLEAMSFGKPTVISNVPGSGMGWVVDDEITGLHFEPQDSQALQERLQYLTSNPSKIIGLGSNGRTKFESEFHIDKSASDISAIYQAVNNPLS